MEIRLENKSYQRDGRGLAWVRGLGRTGGKEDTSGEPGRGGKKEPSLSK